MYFSKSRAFLVFCLAANLGLGFGFHWAEAWLLGLGMAATVLLTLGWRRNTVAVCGGAGLVLAAAGLWAQHKQPADYGQHFGATKTEFTVLVLTDPDVKEKSQSFLTQVQEIGGRVANDRMAIVMPKYPALEYGARIKLKGELEPVTKFNLKDNVSAQSIFPEIVGMETGHGSRVRKKLYDLKRVLLSGMERMVSAPESGLLGGILLGTRKMPDDLLDQFRTTGTSHIIAVSGFNVTIVASFLDGLLRRFGRSASFYSSVIAITGFVIITGASASVVRAGIMGSLGLVAQHFGRLYSSVNALLLTSAIMLFQNPKLLLYDIGFQLSFGALAGLMFVQPLLEDRFPDANPVLASVFPTVAAQVTTSPLILYHFGNFSVVSVLANLLILPGIPLAMLLGAVSLAVFMVAPGLGVIAGSTVWLLLHAIIWVIGLCAAAPLAAINSIPFPLPAMLAYYVLLAIFLTWKTKQKASSST
jgi:competence protein ComEC